MIDKNFKCVIKFLFKYFQHFNLRVKMLGTSQQIAMTSWEVNTSVMQEGTVASGYVMSCDL